MQDKPKKPRGIPIKSLLEKPDFARHFYIEMRSTGADPLFRDELFRLVMESSNIGIKHSKSQSIKSQKSRKTISTDDGKFNREELIRRALINAGTNALTTEVLDHLYSLLDELGMAPREEGAKNTRSIIALVYEDGDAKEVSFKYNTVQRLLRTIRGSSSSGGRPKIKRN